MADLNISLEEYDALRSERDTYKHELDTLQTRYQDLAAGKIGAITRYDREISPQVIQHWATEVWLRIREKLDSTHRNSIMDPWGARYNVDYVNSDMFSDEKLAKNIIEEEIVNFITTQCNTNKRPNINVSTTFVNIDEIINSIKKIWDDKFQKEYAEKVKDTNQKHIEAKKLKREAAEQLAGLERRFENDIFKKDEQINNLTGDKERALERVDQLTNMLAESDRKYLQESMENTGLKDTIHNQKKKIDIIKSLQKTWWWIMFGPKNIEF